jgi:hypothetical protein
MQVGGVDVEVPADGAGGEQVVGSPQGHGQGVRRRPGGPAEPEEVVELGVARRQPGIRRSGKGRDSASGHDVVERPAQHVHVVGEKGGMRKR